MRVGDSDSGLKRVSEYSMEIKIRSSNTVIQNAIQDMSIDLKVEYQCNQACLKANKMLGLKEDFCCKDT